MAKQHNLKNRIVTNSFWNLFSAIISRVGALLFTIILARFLLPEYFGMYSLVFSTAMIFYAFADLGINQAFIRYLSYSLKKEQAKIHSYCLYFFKIKFFITLTASLLLAILAYPLSSFAFKNSLLFLPLLASAIFIFILSLEGFYSSIFYSIEKVIFLSFREIINQTLRISLAFLTFLLVIKNYRVFGIFISLAIVSLILLLFSRFYSKKLLTSLYQGDKEKINKPKIRKFVYFMTIASLATIILSYLDAIFLGIFVSVEYVGFYKAAFSLILGIIGLISFPNVILLSIFTKVANSSMKRLFNLSFRYVSLIAVPCTIGILALGRYIIRFFYGYSYLPSTLSLSILSLIIFPASLVGLFISTFSAKGKPEIFAKLIFFTSLLNIFLNLMFIKLLLPISEAYATAGVASATVLSWIFYLTLGSKFIKREFGVRLNYAFAIKPLLSGVVMFFLVYYFLSLFKEINLIIGFFALLIGIFSYFIILFLIKGINKEDLKIVLILLKK
jgi:O-antigen/teichoic acid export membrane protein